LQLAALELFERQGFEATTIGQIAAAAGVTQMTFFRHFTSKEGVAVDDPYDPIVAAAVAAQPHGLAPLHRVAAGIRAGWAQLPEPENDLVRRRIRVAAASPALRAAAAAANERTEALIVAALVDDGVDAIHAQVAAAATLAALTAALFAWATDADRGLARTITEALDVLEGKR
jgi:AcrR family transcriptional regulator